MPFSSTSHSIKRSWPCNQSKHFRISYQHRIHTSHNLTWLCIWYRDDSPLTHTQIVPPPWPIAYILRFPRVEDDTHLALTLFLSPSHTLHLHRNGNTFPIKTTVDFTRSEDALDRFNPMPQNPLRSLLFPSEATYMLIKEMYATWGGRLGALARVNRSCHNLSLMENTGCL